MVASGDVIEYIERQPQPQCEICSKLREIIRGAFPDIDERMRLGVPYYGDEFYILSLKDHVNLGMSIKWLDPEDIKVLKGTGKTTRSLEFRSLGEVDEKKIVALLDKVRLHGKA